MQLNYLSYILLQVQNLISAKENSMGQNVIIYYLCY